MEVPSSSQPSNQYSSGLELWNKLLSVKYASECEETVASIYRTVGSNLKCLLELLGLGTGDPDIIFAAIEEHITFLSHEVFKQCSKGGYLCLPYFKDDRDLELITKVVKLVQTKYCNSDGRPLWINLQRKAEESLSDEEYHNSVNIRAERLAFLLTYVKNLTMDGMDTDTLLRLTEIDIDPATLNIKHIRIETDKSVNGVRPLLTLLKKKLPTLTRIDVESDVKVTHKDDLGDVELHDCYVVTYSTFSKTVSDLEREKEHEKERENNPIPQGEGQGTPILSRRNLVCSQ